MSLGANRVASTPRPTGGNMGQREVEVLGPVLPLAADWMECPLLPSSPPGPAVQGLSPSASSISHVTLGPCVYSFPEDVCAS